MESSLTVLDRKGGMFRGLLTEVRAARPLTADRIRVKINDAKSDFDISPDEAEDLLRMLDARLAGDGETEASLLLKDGPTLLPDAQRRQAEIENRFRVANQCAHSCSYLRWDAREKIAKCTKDPRGWCTEICPAKEAEEAASKGAEMVA